jgi:hypothetical protein
VRFQRATYCFNSLAGIVHSMTGRRHACRISLTLAVTVFPALGPAAIGAFTKGCSDFLFHRNAAHLPGGSECSGKATVIKA